MPSLSNSPWILGAPSERVGEAYVADQFPDIFGRPVGDLDLHRQQKRKPARCRRITLSGLTIAKPLGTFDAKAYNPANISRST
jgi:hypothetical protein